MRYISFLAILLFFFIDTEAQNPLKQQGAKLVRNGNPAAAIQFLENNLSTIQSDTTLREMEDWLGAFYLLKKDWTRLIDLYKEMPAISAEDSSLLPMARFFRSYSPESISFTNGSTQLPFKHTASGTAIIEVMVNGKKFHFWVDTGAGLTTLSSAVANEAGIHWKQGSTAIAATGNVIESGFGVIDSLRIGGMNVSNHACLVLDHKQLEFKMLGIKLLKIDGIIGWNLLQELAVTIDNKQKQITFGPAGKRTNENNFYWMNIPIVACKDSLGHDLNFFLDTGASETAVYPSYAGKADTSKAERKNITLWSAGGKIKTSSLTYPRVAIYVSGWKMVMKSIHTNVPIEDGLFMPDGVFGNKELIKYVIHFDLQKGEFVLGK